MARKGYALESGGPERLEIAWKPGDLFHLAVQLDGKPLTPVPLWKTLQGTSVRLPDDSFVQILWRVGPGIIDRLRLSRNGRPLPGSSLSVQKRSARKAPAWLRRYIRFLTVAGVLFIALGIFLLIHAYATDLIGVLIAVAFCITGAATVALGIGLSRLKHWARIGTIAVLSIMALGCILGPFTGGAAGLRDQVWILVGVPLAAYGIYLLVARASEFH